MRNAESIQSIYAILDPTTKEVVYVGRSKDPVKRLHYHVHYRSHSSNEDLKKWLQNLRLLDLKPLLRIIKTVSASSAAGEENKQIVRFLKQGHPLFNRQSLNNRNKLTIYELISNPVIDKQVKSLMQYYKISKVSILLKSLIQVEYDKIK